MNVSDFLFSESNKHYAILTLSVFVDVVREKRRKELAMLYQ